MDLDEVHKELYDTLMGIIAEFKERMPPHEFMYGVTRFGMFGLLKAAPEKPLLAVRTINAAFDAAVEMHESMEEE